MILEKIVDEHDLPDEPWNDGDLLWHLYRERGWSQKTLAYEFGVDKQEVLRGLLRHNILRPWTDKETLQRGLEKHQTPAGVAEAWNCSTLTIRRWQSEHRIKKRPELTEDLLQELYHQQQLTVEEIGDDLGYAPVQVHFALEEHGIGRRDGNDRFRR